MTDGGDSTPAVISDKNTTFDYSSVKKEDFPCFGTYEKGNKECEACPFKVDCEATLTK